MGAGSCASTLRAVMDVPSLIEAAALPPPRDRAPAHLRHPSILLAHAVGDLTSAAAVLSQCEAEDPDTQLARACLRFKEGKLDEARAGFERAMSAVGFQPQLAYNIALCRYEAGQYAEALMALGGERLWCECARARAQAWVAVSGTAPTIKPPAPRAQTSSSMACAPTPSSAWVWG